MRQNWIWVVLVIVALVVGYFGGQFTTSASSGDVTDLKARVIALDKQVQDLQTKLASNNSAASGGRLKMAYLDANRVFQNYKGTQGAVEQFKAKREEKQKELEQLKKDFEGTKISSKQYEEAVVKLQQELQLLDLQLTADIQKKMLEVIKKIGEARGFDWVTQRKDVVLYVKDGVMEEITDDVLYELNKAEK